MLEQSVHKTAADREVAGGLEIKGIDCLCLRNPCPLISDTPLSLILGGEKPLVQTPFISSHTLWHLIHLLETAALF